MVAKLVESLTRTSVDIKWLVMSNLLTHVAASPDTPLPTTQTFILPTTLKVVDDRRVEVSIQRPWSHSVNGIASARRRNAYLAFFVLDSGWRGRDHSFHRTLQFRTRSCILIAIIEWCEGSNVDGRKRPYTGSVEGARALNWILIRRVTEAMWNGDKIGYKPGIVRSASCQPYWTDGQ